MDVHLRSPYVDRSIKDLDQGSIWFSVMGRNIRDEPRVTIIQRGYFTGRSRMILEEEFLQRKTEEGHSSHKTDGRSLWVTRNQQGGRGYTERTGRGAS